MSPYDMDRDFFDDYDYYYNDPGICRRCGNDFYGTGVICQDCGEEMNGRQDSEYNIKGERRDAKRAKNRYGLVRHLDPDLRPVKMRTPKIKVVK